jgi:hypothetical protein
MARGVLRLFEPEPPHWVTASTGQFPAAGSGSIPVIFCGMFSAKYPRARYRVRMGEEGANLALRTDLSRKFELRL